MGQGEGLLQDCFHHRPRHFHSKFHAIHNRPRTLSLIADWLWLLRLQEVEDLPGCCRREPGQRGWNTSLQNTAHRGLLAPVRAQVREQVRLQSALLGWDENGPVWTIDDSDWIGRKGRRTDLVWDYLRARARPCCLLASCFAETPPIEL